MPAPFVRQLLSGDNPYSQRVLRTRPANLIAYWPLSEAVGSVAYDLSGNSRNGAYTGVDLGQPGIGDFLPSPMFDGANDYVNVYSAGLAGAFNGNEGTLLVWAKVGSAGIWTDGTARCIVQIRVDASNKLYFLHTTVSGQIEVVYAAGGTANARLVTGQSSVAWQSYAISWSKSANEVRVYLNGSQQGAALTGLGAWVGVLASTVTIIGATSTTPTGVWSGWVAHAVIWSVALTPAEIARLGVL